MDTTAAMDVPEKTIVVDHEDLPTTALDTPSSTAFDSSGGTTVLSRDTDESGDLSESTDVSEYGTDFAAQLRKQRRQVLEKDEQKDLFAESLKKHREQLVDTWEVNQTVIVVPQVDEDKDDPGLCSSSINEGVSIKVNGDVNHDGGRETSTNSILEALEDGLNDEDGDGDFGAFEAAKLGDYSNSSSADDNFFDASILSSDGGGEDIDDGIQTVQDVVSPFLGSENAMIHPTPANESLPIAVTVVGINEEVAVAQPAEGIGIEAGNEFAGGDRRSENMGAGDAHSSQQHATTTSNISVDLDLVPVIPTVDSTVDEEDDFFGDFTERTMESAKKNESSLEIGPDSADEAKGGRSESCGEFEASIETSGQLTRSGFDGASNPQQTESFAGDGVRDFNEVVPSSPPIPPSSAKSSSLEDYDGDDDSGDFNDAVSSQPQGIDEDYEDEAFGDFGDSGPPQAQPHVISNDCGCVDDKLGGFNDPFHSQERKETSADNNDDDAFGDFDDASAAASQPNLPLPSEGDDDASRDFGVVAASEDLDGSDEFGAFGQPDSSLQHDNGGAFGDFGIAAPSEPEPKLVASDDNHGDSFGDFDNATPSQTSAEKSNDTILGDFDGIDPTQPEQMTPEADYRASGDLHDINKAEHQSVAAAEIDDDDFGDFDDARLPQPEAVATVDDVDKDDDAFDDFDDDEFGDFDDAAPSQPLAVSSTHTDVDDVAFGDFDDADPSQAQASAQEGGNAFGNFDSAPAVASESLTPVALMGVIGDKTRSVFAKMQEKYSFPSSDVEETSDDAQSDSETPLGDLLASTNSTVENKGSPPVDLLDQVLSGLSISRGASTLIIEGDGSGPYSTFTYPLGGLRAPDRELEVERQRRSSIRPTHVPDVLPIQLPKGREMPLNASSPSTARKKISKISGPTVPELTSEEKQVREGGFNAESSSANTEQLLSMVPDLNHMLQSTLTLPVT